MDTKSETNDEENNKSRHSEDELNESNHSKDDGSAITIPNTSNREHHQSSSQRNEREPFFAFVPRVGKWVSGIVSNEAKIAQKAISVAPTWTKDFVIETAQYYKDDPSTLFRELISGFTVAIMQVPESIAFSFVVGVSPVSGMQATFWMAFVTGIFGGKPAMISGAAGAMAVVVADLTSDSGPLKDLTSAERFNVLFMTMFICGIIQVLMAWLRLAKVVQMIPETGLIGYMNGLAIIIFIAQLTAFQYCDEEDLFMDCTEDQRHYMNFQSHPWELSLTLIHVILCMVIMKFFPFIPHLGKWIPSSLVGLLIGSILEHTLFRQVFDVSTRTVEETAVIDGSFPKFNWPSIPGDSNTITTMMSFAFTLAIIGGVESVLTLQACCELTSTLAKVSESNQELFAQGLGNMMAGLFSAMGGDAMMGQSTINIMNGARHRLSAVMAGVSMLLFTVGLDPLIKLLPVATLTGVLFMVVLSTFQWKTFFILRYGRISDSIAILLVTLTAVWYNLAVSIGLGVVFSALHHTWDSGSLVEGEITYKNMMIDGEECFVKYVKLKGALFFSSKRKFVTMFSFQVDPETVVLDLENALIVDHSAVAAIQALTNRFKKANKRVLLTNLTTKSHARLNRTGNLDQLQLTDRMNIIDIEGNRIPETPAEGGKKGHRRVSSAAQALAAVTPDRMVNQYEVGEMLGNLAIFQNPREFVDDHVEFLLQDQGPVDIQEKKEE